MVTRKRRSGPHPRRMEAGALLPFVERYSADLTQLGYRPLTISGIAASARHFAAWLNSAEISLSSVDDAVLTRFARHRCRCGGYRHQDRMSSKYVRRVRRFMKFLAEHRVVSGYTQAQPRRADARVAAFQDWLRHHRGISEQTIKRHGIMVTRLLPALGGDPSLYDAERIRQTIVSEARDCTAVFVKTMTTALRGYLRFLAGRGECRAGLEHAVPVVPQWRLSSLPRYLPEADVEKVIASCDPATTLGKRDRAVLLLLARLGLRGGDVCALRLDDVDWREATLRVRGKGRREIRLPLPQDAGDALLDYLEHGRPSSDDDHVFVRAYAPHNAFKVSSAISCIVRAALERAAIAHPPSRGANLLRHSAATAMLRAGASLDAIGTVLRHRSANTTAHYAKVDVNMLREIAQPWPGEV